MARDPKQLVGTVVADRYRLVGVLGGGGGGMVYEARDASTGKPAALKLLGAPDADLAGRLEREALALSRLAHPNIVAFVGAGHLEDGTPYLVTELIRGTSVRDALAFDVFEPRRALAIVGQMLDALAHIHGAGMIHRDVKPENLMFVDGGDPARPTDELIKLIDFGVAKVLDQNSDILGARKLTRARLELVGSPQYVAPESAIGEPLDARTDLYSVGIVLFEMLSGRVPFQHDKTSTLLRMHVTEPVPPLRVVVPRELDQIVRTALAKEPDERFASADAMHSAVDAVARGLDDGPRAPRT
jgi:serine/threonine protein kinase